MHRIRFFLFVSLFLMFALAQPGAGRADGDIVFAADTLDIETDAARHAFRVELALTPKQRARGLMFRQTLEADRGMLFVYPRDQVITMWMKNTFISLDMLFIDQAGRVVAVRERTTPQSLAVISSGVRARAVLELAAGTAARLNLKVGNRVLSPVFSGGG